MMAFWPITFEPVRKILASFDAALKLFHRQHPFEAKVPKKLPDAALVGVLQSAVDEVREHFFGEVGDVRHGAGSGPQSYLAAFCGWARARAPRVAALLSFAFICRATRGRMDWIRARWGNR